MKFLFLMVPLSTAIFLSACGGDSDYRKKGNIPPYAASANFVTQADTALATKITGTDGDQDILTFTITSMPSQGSVNLQTNGNFTYMPNTDTTGDDQFSFTVSDGKVISSPAAVTIKIDPLQVNLSSYSRTAFGQMQNQEPLSLNTRNVMQDVANENAYDDLLM